MRSGRDSQSSVIDFLTGFVFAIILVALIGPCEAQGQCREGLSLRLVNMTHEETEGFFVTTVDTGCLMLALERSPLLEAQLRRMERRRDMADARYDDMLQATQHGTEIISSYADALASSLRRTVAAEAANDSIWSSPFFWYVAGIITSAAVALSIWLGGS